MVKDFLRIRRWRPGALGGLLGTSALVLTALGADIGAEPGHELIGGPSMAAGSPTQIAISPDGARACVINGCGLNGCVGSVSVLDLATNSMIGAPIVVGTNPSGVGIAPNGARAYVVNEGDYTVSVIDLATHTLIGRPIGVGRPPMFYHRAECDVAFTPDGARAYVTIGGDHAVSEIDLATNRATSFPIAGRHGAWKVAITRNGVRTVVLVDSSLSIVDLATNTVVGASIATGGWPTEMAITPDGTRGCVLNDTWVNGVNRPSVSLIDLATNTMMGSPIALGVAHRTNRSFVAIAPDGARACVTNMGFGTVSVVHLAANAVIDSPIDVGTNTYGVAITPDGAHAYATNTDAGTVSVIDLARNELIGSIAVGSPLSTAGYRRAAAAGRLGGLETAVAELLTAGSLKRSQADALTKKLERVRKTAAEPCASCDSDPGYYNRGLTDQLVSFRQQVSQLITKGALTPADGQRLSDAAGVALRELNR